MYAADPRLTTRDPIRPASPASPDAAREAWSPGSEFPGAPRFEPLRRLGAGGYPVIAGVVAEDLPAAAQMPPGSSIRFVLVDPLTHNPHQPQAADCPGHKGKTA